MPEANYDPRYLKGIEEFNRRNYFESHEIWEDLWIDHCGPDREFFKGLIQAAVALHHWTRGNLGGALTLWRRSRGYLQPYGTAIWGSICKVCWRLWPVYSSGRMKQACSQKPLAIRCSHNCARSRRYGGRGIPAPLRMNLLPGVLFQGIEGA